MSLIENGVNPDALAVSVSVCEGQGMKTDQRRFMGQTVIKDLRKESASKTVSNVQATAE